MMRGWKLVAWMSAMMIIAPPVYANYYLGKVVNNTGNAVTVGSILPAGLVVNRAGLGNNTLELVIGVPKAGVVRIYENGVPKCPGFNWSAQIEYAGQKWGFGYEGDGVINITLNADNSLTLGGSGTPGGNGKVFPGGC